MTVNLQKSKMKNTEKKKNYLMFFYKQFYEYRGVGAKESAGIS